MTNHVGRKRCQSIEEAKDKRNQRQRANPIRVNALDAVYMGSLAAYI
jgi:hypothetical protein